MWGRLGHRGGHSDGGQRSSGSWKKRFIGIGKACSSACNCPTARHGLTARHGPGPAQLGHSSGTARTQAGHRSGTGRAGPGGGSHSGQIREKLRLSNRDGHPSASKHRHRLTRLWPRQRQKGTVSRFQKWNVDRDSRRCDGRSVTNAGSRSEISPSGVAARQNDAEPPNCPGRTRGSSHPARIRRKIAPLQPG